MWKISRRQALALVAASGLASACATSPEADSQIVDVAEGGSQVFLHGVASGDPDETSLILWTRVTTAGTDAQVAWVICRDAGCREIVARGITTASASRDHTVKVLAGDLEPGTTYYYRFETSSAFSPIGRTRTLPRGQLDRLGIALATCSNYPFGYFNAYDAIARDDQIDFVLHTGDYIYEYGGVEGWGEETGHVLDRPHDPPHEIVTLADYRRRHAQYKTDAGLRAMHAAHPFLCCWDDHESANNPWAEGAQNHQPETEGSWPVRRDAALQAYYEWMPIREPETGHTRAQFWRRYAFGNLATLVTLETRHTARSRQIDYAEWQPKLNTEADYEAFRRDILGDASRRMISSEMEADLSKALAASIESGQPWRLIGNPSPIARMLVPDLIKSGVLPAPDETSLEAHKRLAWLGAHGLPFYTDTWDGYPAAREAFYNLARAQGVSDLVFLTGDSHSFWANRLADSSGRPVGIELGTSGITSPGDFVDSGFDTETAMALDAAFANQLPEVLWTDNMHQGYVRVVLGRKTGRADFVAVDTVLSSDYRAFVIKTVDLIFDNGNVDFAGS